MSRNNQPQRNHRIKEISLVKKIIKVEKSGLGSRKQMMEEKADIFLALPGSFGTLDEIMQVIVTKQLSYHKKAIIFFDIDNYYKPLFNMFENFYQYGFAREFNRELYFITDRIDGIFEYCSQYEEKEFILPINETIKLNFAKLYYFIIVYISFF